MRYKDYINSMPEMSSMPLPVIRALRQLGHDLALARRRRRISTADMADRLFISRRTLWRLEKGDPTVSLGAFANATFVLQLHERLAQLAAPAHDALAFELDEERLPKRIRGKKS
jgi:transcriptional regulator with XRE-family HTH domain